MALVVAGVLPGAPALAGVTKGVTKIVPTDGAEPGERFTIIDTLERRLVDGSVAVFRLNGGEVIIPLRTHKPYNRAKGMLPAGMGGGDYQVSVRTPGGTEFLVGMFKVIAPVLPPTPTEPYITPTHGQMGTPFTITDPQGRMVPGDIVVFYVMATDPQRGTEAIGVIVDGTTFTGTVPAVTPMLYAVRVRPWNLWDSLFPDLEFMVDP